MTKLTKKQIHFAETHMNLIDDFLKREHLSFDHYYDIVVFGYLEAVVYYLRHSHEIEGCFDTLANAFMKKTLKKDHFPKHFAPFSLNATIPGTNIEYISLFGQEDSGYLRVEEAEEKDLLSLAAA